MAFNISFWRLERSGLSRRHHRSKKKSNGVGISVGYGIPDGYDDDVDDNDEERSRGIPSRTSIGKRGSIIEKFPSLGEPLVLFGGLITVPFWGYRNTPIALLDVMMSDLPHVMYHPPKPTHEEEENRVIVMRDMRKKIKKDGLAGVGLNLEISSKKVIDGNKLLEELRNKK